jgi:hypothetical protein
MKQETVTQTMIKTLARLRLAGLESPFGTMPQNAEQYKLQAEAYVDTIQAILGKPAESEIIARTALWFLTNQGDEQSQKLPSAAQFGNRYKNERAKDYTTIGVFCGEDIKILEIRKDMPESEVQALVERTEKELGVIKPLPCRTVEESKELIRRFEAPKPKIVEESAETLEARRDLLNEQIKMLTGGEVLQ